MRIALVAGSAFIAAAIGIFACSGSDTPAAATPDAGGSTTPPDDGTSGAATGTSGSDGTSGTSGSSGTSGTDAAGTSTSSSSSTSGAPPTNDGGDIEDAGAPIDGGDAGTKCRQFSIAETEPNDTSPGNVLPSASSSFCGSISSPTDVDYVSFTLPATATALQMSESSTNAAAFKVDATADGVSFDFGGTYPFKQGKVYILKISSSNASTFDYLLEVNITTP